MNYNTQNAKIASISEKTLIVGIDIGSETHFARAFDWRNYEYTKKAFEFSNTEEGFQSFKAWMEELSAKHGKTAVIPGMEPTGHYWFALGKYLQDNGMRPVHVNLHHVKRSKELDDNNPNKNDRKDPKTIAGLVNEGAFLIPLYTNWCLCGNQKFIEPTVSGTGRAYQSQKTACQMVLHLLSGV